MIGLDQLKTLIHHGGAIDLDLGAHAPIGVGHRLLSVMPRHFRPASWCGKRPPEAVRMIFSDLVFSDPKSKNLENSRNARYRPEPGWRHDRATAFITKEPAQTRVSLVGQTRGGARASMAARVGCKPAAPTIEAITQSAGRAAASITARLTGGDFDTGARERLLEIGVSRRIGDHGQLGRAISGAMEAGTIPMGTGIAQAPVRMAVGSSKRSQQARAQRWPPNSSA